MLVEHTMLLSHDDAIEMRLGASGVLCIGTVLKAAREEVTLASIRHSTVQAQRLAPRTCHAYRLGIG